jgi:arginyl-tRNA synthetase
MNYPLLTIKQDITTALQQGLKILKLTADIRLEIPPENMGDFAFPCFTLAAQEKQAPKTIAQTLQKNMKKPKGVTKIQPHGGYLNFYLDHHTIIHSTLQEIIKRDQTYGYLPKKKKKVIIEHTSANPNGPLHVGRARNPIIGDTLVRIFKAAGYQVQSQFYLDDMGKQVAILTWGVQNIDQKKLRTTKNQKPDHQYVAFYQTANKHIEKDPKVATAIGTIVKHLEQGEPETINAVHQAYNPVLNGIKESLNRINITIDSFIPESQFVANHSVDDVVNKLKQTPYCHQEEGAYYLDLEPFGVRGRNTKFFFLRKDGTTLYATRDIAYHQWKATQADQLINILGEDHKLESKQVEIALTLLKTPNIPHVVFYAFVSLPGGKMSTRRGRVVYLDDLIEECIQRAYQEVKKRRGTELTEPKMKTIAEIVGIGALRYNIIKVQPEKDIVFKWEDALNFEGNAVPFIQYAHARACSILEKSTEKPGKFTTSLLTHDSELKLGKQLAQLPLFIEEAARGCKPHLITTYLYNTAGLFNQFYRDCPVLPEPDKDLRITRITLVNATRVLLRNTLTLLGITAPEEM